ncbi:MAG: phenylacetic acid degradation operon negative regulatory protein PaaX [Pseudomonadota bacterium]
MGVTDLIQPLIASFASQKPLRTGSLIVTIFGDAIAPRGGVVWLGSLIRILQPIGLSERVIRTAAYRLVQDGMLSNRQQGKKSFYTLTNSGRAQFDEATLRIYGTPNETWDGQWCMVLTHQLQTQERTAVRRDLNWLGFGQLNTDTLIHPNPEMSRLAGHLKRLGVAESCPVIQGSLQDLGTDLSAQLVATSWDLAALEAAYERMINQFAPILEAIQNLGTIAPADAFYTRTFLIHEYRKTLLRDPQLPYALLPRSWRGRAAYELTRDLYRTVVAASEQFAELNLENESGRLSQPSRSFYARLGGLQAD